MGKSKDDEKAAAIGGKERVQIELKRLSPSAADSIPISQIPDHCAKIMSLALNLEWFGHEGRTPRVAEGAEQPVRNVIVVRVAKLDITLAAFVTKIREILNRIE